MNQSLFKYIPNQFLEQYVEEGQILFRPLSYFIAEYQEPKGVWARSDPSEGNIEHDIQRVDEVYINKKKYAIVPDTFYAWQKYENPHNYFIHSCSKKLSSKLFADFKSDRCIEITDTSTFIEMLKANVTFSKLCHDHVEYKDKIQSPKKDLFFYKTVKYIDQSEYRFCFAINHLEKEKKYHFSFEREPNILMCSRFSEIVLKIGNISKLIKVHKES